jgi:XRE family transcriptional regulator, regulator of sulfur utilization
MEDRPHEVASNVERPPSMRASPPAIGPRLQAIRKKRRLSLDELATASGVSRSMLSQIERGQTNPTMAIVWNVTHALNVDLAELMGVTSSARHRGIEVTQPSFTPQIQTEDALCILRILSPPHAAGGVEWYDLTILPGGALVSEPHLRGAAEHLTVREGEIAVTSGDANQVVGPNATARYAADLPHALRNNGAVAAKAFLVVVNPIR